MTAVIEVEGLCKAYGQRRAGRVRAVDGLDLSVPAGARLNRARVDRVLERVGLGDRADDPARGYSLGMRQRLGLAIALLKDPEVLILDEPANGLDPAGIREIRTLVRELAGEGRTVFLSSHLLGEVELMCDEVAILARGRTVASGAIDEVLKAARPSAVWVKVTDLVGGARTLASTSHRRAPRTSRGPWSATATTRQNCDRSRPAWRMPSSP